MKNHEFAVTEFKFINVSLIDFRTGENSIGKCVKKSFHLSKAQDKGI